MMYNFQAYQLTDNLNAMPGYGIITRDVLNS